MHKSKKDKVVEINHFFYAKFFVMIISVLGYRIEMRYHVYCMKEIFDGRWELNGTIGKKYLLVNIYNKNKTTITYKQLQKLRNGKDTISHIISRRINLDSPFLTNNVTKGYKEIKQRYAHHTVHQ